MRRPESLRIFYNVLSYAHLTLDLIVAFLIRARQSRVYDIGGRIETALLEETAADKGMQADAAEPRD